MADKDDLTGWEVAEQLLKDKPQTAKFEFRLGWPYSLGYPACPVGVIYELILVDGTRAEAWVDLSHQYEASGPDWRRVGTREGISEAVVVAWRRKPEETQVETPSENCVQVERDSEGKPIKFGGSDVIAGPCRSSLETTIVGTEWAESRAIHIRRPVFFNVVEIDGEWYGVEQK